MKNSKRIVVFGCHRRVAGVTLIELMVALGIGSFLIIGAITVFTQSRTTFRVTESIARLQENARFALDRLEPDIRMASFWGLTSRSHKIQGRSAQTAPLSPPRVANDCGNNWTIDLAEEVGGTNNGYTWGCTAFGGVPSPTSDSLVIRRATVDPVTVPIDPNALHIQSARVVDGQLFRAATPPALAGISQTHRLVVSGYYVSQTSTLSTPDNLIPSLRVKTLIGGSSGPRIADREVLPGVEDMQIQFGIDTDVVGAPNRGSADRFVNPGDPLLDPALNPNIEVLAVRLWLRIRAERRENSFTDTTNYVYADQNIAAPNDVFRRTVVSKTIYLRNNRPAS